MNYDAIEVRTRRRERLRKGSTYVCLVIWALMVLFPFYWMLLSSLKSYSAYNSEYVPRFFTLSPTLQNYTDAFTAVPLARYFLNTLIFTLATTAIMLVVITLAAFAQVGAAAVRRVAPLDTHWIWQDGQNLLEDTPQIIGGKLQVPSKPGLGVTLNMRRVEEANRLYNSLPSHDRDDAMAMQYLIPGWKYDHKKPCLVR